MRRLIDVFASAALLLLGTPLFLITALAIRLTEPGDVFYRQARAGLRGRPFELLKFRSMRVNNLPIDDVTEIRDGHALVTPVGRWIRRLKVDELPQLLNVLRGDMALIGPRPALPEQVLNYNAFERRRLDTRPGMTGWAQVNGGIELAWPERIMLDVWYVDHRSFWMDAVILWRTAAVILFGDKRNSGALDEAIVYANQRMAMAELNTRQLMIARTGPYRLANAAVAMGRANREPILPEGGQPRTGPSSTDTNAQPAHGHGAGAQPSCAISRQDS